MLEKVNLGYSKKNIPFANERRYKLNLLEKTEALIKRMRWKAIFFLSENEGDDEESPETPETYGLPSKKCPAQVKELIPFENDLLKLAKNVEFKQISNEFQTQM